MPAAFNAVEAAYREGFTCAVEIDTVDFYGSVRLEGLADLMRPLPETVVRHVVWDGGFMTRMRRDERVSVFMRDDDPSSSAQQGIALGSACSPIVGERILANLLAPSDSIRLVAYADNILVVNRRSIGTPYRRAKGTPLRLCGSVDAGRVFRAAGGVGRA